MSARFFSDCRRLSASARSRAGRAAAGHGVRRALSTGAPGHGYVTRGKTGGVNIPLPVSQYVAAPNIPAMRSRSMPRSPAKIVHSTAHASPVGACLNICRKMLLRSSTAFSNIRTGMPCFYSNRLRHHVWCWQGRDELAGDCRSKIGSGQCPNRRTYRSDAARLAGEGGRLPRFSHRCVFPWLYRCPFKQLLRQPVGAVKMSVAPKNGRYRFDF